MPLVDYGSSDGSDSESSGEEKNVESVGKVDLVKKAGSKEEKKEDDSFHPNFPIFKESSFDLNCTEHKLFAQLPVPKSNFSLGEDALRLLSKNKNQPVKILLPSLNDLHSSDNDEIKKKKPTTKGSGLFALLPAPKNVNNLIPKILSKKLNNHNKSKTVSKVKQLSLSQSTSLTKSDDEDDEQEANPSSFFFTSNDDNALPEVVTDKPFTYVGESDYSSSLLTQFSNRVDMPVANSAASSEINNHSHLKNESDAAAMLEVQSNQDLGNLDDEAIEKLCGTRARKRKGEISEEVIDINVDSMVGDAYMWLSKDLTKGHEHRSYKKAKNLSVVERRKHQITYLASQAKEKEMELRNQWANSRMTRKQTQSKYGF